LFADNDRKFIAENEIFYNGVCKMLTKQQQVKKYIHDAIEKKNVEF